MAPVMRRAPLIKEQHVKRISKVFAVCAVVASVAMALPSLGNSASAAGSSEVYVVHGIPGVPVDVYVAGNLTLTDFQPNAVAGPLTLPAGDYRVQIFAHVADPPEAAPASGAVIDKTETVPSGASVSLIANLDASGMPALNAFANDLSPVADGMARVTVRHTAFAPAVDIYVDGAKAVSDLTNPNEAIAEIPAGSHEVAVKVAGTDTTVIGPAMLNFAANTNTVVYAIGSVRGENLGVIPQVLATMVQATTTTTTTAPATTPAPTTTMRPAQAAPAMQAQPTYTG